jgi:two-component system chemotaxis response regulator CheY
MVLIQPTNSLMNDLSVVIADDDDVTRQMLRALLRSAGLIVIGEASDGAQALALYQKQKPQVLCLDIEMPVMNGLEILKTIRQEDTQTIVLMITAAATGENVHAAIAAKASGIIVKPFNTAKIVNAMERAIASHKAAEPLAAVGKASAFP